jgi:hypothetical protein
MNIGQLSLFIFLLRPHSYSTGSWLANNVYELNGYVFEVKEGAVSRILIYISRMKVGDWFLLNICRAGLVQI